MLDKDKAMQLEQAVLNRISVDKDNSILEAIKPFIVKTVIVTLQEYEKLDNN